MRAVDKIHLLIFNSLPLNYSIDVLNVLKFIEFTEFQKKKKEFASYRI